MRTVWIVAQRIGGSPLSWHRNVWDALGNLTRRIEADPLATYTLQSFGVDEPSVDFDSDEAVTAWLGDFNPWDV